jgi:signal transduction histidine kinase
MLVTLSAPDSTKLCCLKTNQRWVPSWHLVLSSAWTLSGLLWLACMGLLLRQTREETFVGAEDHHEAILAEQEAAEEALDEAHQQRTAQTRARLGQIADSLAHDLNTPLDAIRKNLELIRDSCSIDVRYEIGRILNDEALATDFIVLLSGQVRDPSVLPLAEVNGRTARLEDFFDNDYPEVAAKVDPALFARNGFDESSARAFIEKFGPENSVRLISLLDREASARRAVRLSLDQVNLSLGIANRLKNLTSRKAFDIRLGVESALQMLQGDLAAHKISVRQNYIDLPGLRGDPLPIIETITVIVQNAIDVLPDGGEIGIDGSLRGDRLVIAVGNNGPQIPKESLPKIWDRGFSQGKPSGMGLGLYIAKDLIEQAGGTIEARSDPGWTEFEISLPLTPSPDPG